MAYAVTEFDNSYVTIQNKELDIHYRKKRFKVALDKVAKIYLSKKKSRYCTWFPAIERFIDPEFNLCIQTNDNEQISMEVRASEKQYFIDPIAIVRNMKRTS